MRRLLYFSTLAVLAALVGFTTSACRPGATSEHEGHWRFTDLTALTPTVEAGAPASAFEIATGFLGSQEVRDLTKVPASTAASFPHQSAGQVETLIQQPGSRLAWTLELGSEPYLTFTPLADEEFGCPCTFRAGIRQADGSVVELFQLAPDFLSPGTQVPDGVAPRGSVAAEEIDLGRWSGQRVDLLLQIDPPPGGSRRSARMRWASPAVFDRSPATQASSGEKPNLILIGIDTLRADHLGAWRQPPANGWAPPSLTPALDRLADQSDVWLDAYSTFNVTNPSFASIMTGLYGKNHGIYDLRTPLPPGHTTLAELLKEAGYETLAVIAARHLGDHNSGLGQGFDTVITAQEHSAAEGAIASAMSWIAERGEASDRPYFVWLHLFDPHTPHVPPQPYAQGLRPATAYGAQPVAAWTPFRRTGPVAFDQPVLAGHSALYAGEVAYTDRQLGRFLDFVDSRGGRADTLVALTADHGENLGEHAILHRHGGLWETTTHVPLMVRWPRRTSSTAEPAGRRIRGLVQTLDLFPTLLAAVGLEVPPQDGEDLRVLTAEGRRGRRAVFSEHASLLGVSVRTPTHRWMKSSGNPQVPAGDYLFDLTADPAESKNLAGTGLAVEQQLSELLTRWLEDRRPAADATPRDLSQEEIERLRSLGYL